MKLYDYIPQAQLEDAIAQGLVGQQSHPDYPNLRIFSYTPKSQQVKPAEWTNAMSRCRGLIADMNTGEVLARPFEKFWNLSQMARIAIPADAPMLWEKLDGSMITAYFYDGKIRFATRGSFASEQAKWAQNWYDTTIKVPALFDDAALYTYVMEAIGAPQTFGGFNRNGIVVKYERSGLVMLAKISIETGEERPVYGWCLPFGDAGFFTPGIGQRTGISLAGLTQEEIASWDKDNEEGYVATWYIAGRPPLRYKIKFASYCRMHRLLTQHSEWDIWDALRKKESFAWVHGDDIPADFRNWILAYAEELHRKVFNMRCTVYAELDKCLDVVGTADLPAIAANKELRKKFALAANAYDTKWLRASLFAYLVGNLDDKAIWAMVEPSGVKKETEAA